MRLHRIRLRNYRGVQDSSVEFAAGLTVVEGPNEAGKSSLAEALRVLKTRKSSSRARDIQELRPVGKDVGPEVEALISAGPYTLTYRKRWLNSPLTELEISGGTVEQLVGEEAHDRFESILRETVDTDLLTALDVHQGSSLDQASLAHIPAVQSVLTHTSGETGLLTDHDDLLDKLAEERALYFTAHGRPTGAYAKAIREAENSAASVEELRGESRKIDELIDSQMRATAKWEGLRKKIELDQAELAELSQRRNEMQELSKRAEKLQLDADQAAARLADAEREIKERTAVENETRERERALTSALGECDAADEAVAALKEPLQLAEESVKRARLRTERLREEERTARSDLELLQDQRELADLSKLKAQAEILEKTKEASTLLERSIGIEDADVRRLEQLDLELRVASQLRKSGAAAVSVVRLGDQEVVLDGDPVPAGASREVSAVRNVLVEVPGIAQITVEPGSDSQGLAAKEEEARTELADELEKLNVASVDEAREKLRTKETARADTDRAAANLQLILGNRTLHSLNLDHAEIENRLVGRELSTAKSLADAREVAQVAAASLAEAEEQAESAADKLSLLRDRMAQANERFILLSEQKRASQEELRRMQKKLEELRSHRSDKELEETVEAARAAWEKRLEVAETAQKQVASLDPDELEHEYQDAQEILQTTQERAETAKSELDNLGGQLDRFAQEGVFDRLEEQTARAEAASNALSHLTRRAQAIEVLHEVMQRKKSEAQRAYVEPFRKKIESLGRRVFAADFSVEISPELTVVARTVAGQTVPFESLSVGAREQISLLGRLACAQLVSEGEGAPLILDDTLGFADPDRLRALNRLLSEVGRSAQVIVLTCQPDRFGRLAGASFASMGHQPAL